MGEKIIDRCENCDRKISLEEYAKNDGLCNKCAGVESDEELLDIAEKDDDKDVDEYEQGLEAEFDSQGTKTESHLFQMDIDNESE